MIALVDCNNFYASCERLFRPKLAEKPVIVLSNNDGCIIARSNEAKALGIGMGEPFFKVKELIERHDIAVFSSNYALYGDISDRVMKTLYEFAPQIEVYSIDEAFLDLSNLRHTDIFEYCQMIRAKVRQYTGIPVSIGIAPTKTLAKLANNYAKKHRKETGVCILDNDVDTQIALQMTKVEDIWGIGRQYTKFLMQNHINTAYDFLQLPQNWILKNLKIVGLRTQNELNGKPCISLMLNPEPKKSILSSRSFVKKISTIEPMKDAVACFAARCGEKLRQQGSCASLLHVYIQTNPFRPEEKQYFNSIVIQLAIPTSYTPSLIEAAHKALARIYKDGYRYKKASVMVSGIVPNNQLQANLFEEQLQTHRERTLVHKMDSLNKLMGRDKIKFAAQGNLWKYQPDDSKKYVSPANCYTTRIHEILTVDEKLHEKY